jgi:hypothetical protein
MLQPRDRTLLFDALRPPIGYQLDLAVGTSYTLDLFTLLTIPLSFTMSDCNDEEGNINPDPLALLNSIRRYSEKMAVFCQAGRILVPPKKLMLANLENSVVQVTARHPHGLFHPKVWVLRFVPTGDVEPGPDTLPVKYRCIVASRNITFDRSWDTVVILDGELGQQPNQEQTNPLKQFVSFLPRQMVKSTSPDAKEQARSICQTIAGELDRVTFELPEGFTDLKLLPLGIHAKNPPMPWSTSPDSYGNLVVISPFLSDRILKDLAASASRPTLVSREHALDKLDPNTRSAFQQDIFYMDPAADPEDVQENLEEPVTDSETQESLAGLHAKIVLADQGTNSHLWTGSANATNAAFERNVEFLVQLTGPRHLCGVDAFLGDDESPAGFRGLLVPYSPPDKEFEAEDQDLREINEQIDSLRVQLATSDLQAQVSNHEEDDRFDITLTVERGLQVSEQLTVRCWPTTLDQNSFARPLEGTVTEVPFQGVSFEGLTSFYAFTIRSELEGAQTCQFVLNIPLQGAPEDRMQKLLLNVLNNRGSVLRYLYLLLADDGMQARQVIHTLLSHEKDTSHQDRPAGIDSFPLLESLLQALASDPDKIDRVHRVVEDLRKTDKGRKHLPEGFADAWDPVWEYRSKLLATGESR